MGEDCIHPYAHRWPFDGIGQGLDWRAVRRGRQVYSEVFAPCHSLNYLWWRNFSYFMTAEEIKTLASDYTALKEEPEEDGTYLERPQKHTDNLPAPYKNDREAAYSNGGAVPPDLSNIVRARHDGTNYVYALLTGYKDELPAGMPEPQPGQYFNPYFPGGMIGMPPPLADDMLEYEDGTQANKFQMAKDVTQFLEWCHWPYYDIKEKLAIKGAMTLCFLGLGCGWYSRRLVSTYMRGRVTIYANHKY